jgi:hypothetical protein
MRGLNDFMKQFGAADGILITKNHSGKERVEAGTVYLVPAGVFLLSTGNLL